MATPQRKIMKPLEVKCMPEAPEGAQLRATLVVATMGVKDKDDDILEPGSVGMQRCLMGNWGHTISRGSVPIGKAGLHEEGDKLIAEVEFNPAIQSAMEAYESIRFAPELTEVSFGLIPEEWSFDASYNRVIKKMKVFEVSPVVMGAGVDTGVMSVKEAKGIELKEFKEREQKSAGSAADVDATPEPEEKAAPEEPAEPEFVPTAGLIQALAYYAGR